VALALETPSNVVQAAPHPRYFFPANRENECPAPLKIVDDLFFCFYVL
jgi:hypothetical protein